MDPAPLELLIHLAAVMAIHAAIHAAGIATANWLYKPEQPQSIEAFRKSVLWGVPGYDFFALTFVFGTGYVTTLLS